MSLARNTLVQASLTLGSRILGFARDLALAAQFGQGPLMDAWATALMAPNLFRRLFAEGAFAQAFVPIYGRVKAEEGDAPAADAASQSLSFLLLVVVTFVIVAQVAMPWIMPLLLSAYRDQPETLRLATTATQLAMPYLACMALASLLSGVLNTSGRFALSAGVPALLNVCTLVPLLLIRDPEAGLLATSAAVTGAGLLQAGILWWGVRKLGVRLHVRPPRLSPVVRRILTLAVPGALAGGATQMNSLVSQVLTGSDPGARSVLYNADRLYQLPLGLVGVAIGLALVPRLTRSFVSGDEAGARSTLDDGIALAMAFTLPAAVALFVIPYFLIDATVTRGAFTSEDAARTSDVLRHFAWGVPAFVLAKVFTPPFFARQDMRRPMNFAVITVVVNIVLGAGLYFGLGRFGVDGVVGLAIATSISAWLNVLLLAGTLAREGVYRPGPAVVNRLLRIVAASAVMGAVLWLFAMNYDLLAGLLWRKELAIVVACLAGFGVYGAAVLAFRAVSPSELRAALRREPGAASPAMGLEVMTNAPASETLRYGGPLRVLSGVQPSGALHLGNYLGALKKFVRLQEQRECFIFVADMHAITVWQDPAKLAAQTREIAAAYLASGLDPNKAAIFPQSAVRAHAELAWILNCTARLGWLDRMTQFKEKSGKHKERASVGLYTYPVLQAADILVYKATHVPVGEDQKQHLELTRDIAAKFNNDFEAPGFFPLPEPLIQGPGARIMSLRDGSAKMSKSDPSDQSRINLLDDADAIAQKIKRARTDPEPLPETVEGLAGRAEAANLVGVYAALAGVSNAEVLSRFAGQGFAAFKPALVELAVESLGPVGAEMRRLMNDPAEIDRVLREGAERAAAVAEPTVAETKRLVGFWS